MSLTAESLARPSPSISELQLDTPSSDRRADLDAKQTRVAALLQEVGCDGLLVLEPENFAWLTSGGTSRGVLDPVAQPALYFTAEQRWLIAANVDSQRLFEEDLDGLGFQLKEWPWHWGRQQLLSDLCQNRRVACDHVRGDFPQIGDRLRLWRRTLTAYEQACCLALGQIVSHALEATCRTMTPGETERELAGQLSHRLIHRGVHPVQVTVAADGRSRAFRQHGFTSAPIHKYAVLSATGRKYGLCVTASRAMSFGQPEATFLREHNAVCKISATYLASTWPDAMPSQILMAGRRIYQMTGFEHEWQLAPQGHLGGRAPVELALLPRTDELFQPGWMVTWHVSVGAAVSCDSYLISEQGPRLVTPTELWPLKRIRVQGADFVRPDLLQR